MILRLLASPGENSLLTSARERRRRSLRERKLGPSDQIAGVMEGDFPLRCRGSAWGWRQESELLFDMACNKYTEYLGTLPG